MKKTLLTAITLSFALGAVSPVESAWNPFNRKKQASPATAAAGKAAAPARRGWGLKRPGFMKRRSAPAKASAAASATAAKPTASRNPFARMGKSVKNFRQRRTDAKTAALAALPKPIVATVAVPDKPKDKFVYKETPAINGLSESYKEYPLHPTPPLQGNSLATMVEWSKRFPTVTNKGAWLNCKRKFTPRFRAAQAKDLNPATLGCDPHIISTYLWQLVNKRKASEQAVLTRVHTNYVVRLRDVNAQIQNKNAQERAAARARLQEQVQNVASVARQRAEDAQAQREQQAAEAQQFNDLSMASNQELNNAGFDEQLGAADDSAAMGFGALGSMPGGDSMGGAAGMDYAPEGAQYGGEEEFAGEEFAGEEFAGEGAMDYAPEGAQYGGEEEFAEEEFAEEEAMY